MKQRNWLVIGGILSFIFAYDYFVVRPFNLKNKPAAPVATKSESSVETTQTTTANAQLSKYTNSNINNLKIKLATENATLSIAPNRTVKIFSDGSINQALVSDFKDNKKENISLIQNPLRWSSSDVAVETCLRSLVSENGTTFFANTNLGTCFVEYSALDRQKSAMRVNLKLNGFEGSQGFVWMSTTGNIDEKRPAPDQWGLGWSASDKTHFLKGEKPLITKIELDPSKTQGIDWLIWGDRYFATVFSPTGSSKPNVYLKNDGETRNTEYGVSYPVRSATKSPAEYSFDLYFGPRSTEGLLAINEKLDKAVEYGWFPSVSKAMLWALKGLNALFHNFGISIIILTLLVRMAFWPLNKKVFSSGQKMKLLQPEMDRIKEKYKDKADMEKMNKEIFALYKTHGVNPMGSCLPLLAQMPIFIGLYGALNHSIDLYQAPFFAWVTDLSSKDPFYVLPILWTLSLLVTGFMNPTPTQPGQPDMKWIMFGMNILFGFISKDWPSGLCLYLLVSNLVGIIQQLMMKRAVKMQPVQEGV